MTTGSTARPPATPPSFARRHPILTGFGILAGVSLFAAYFPISAVVTAVVVGAHASGADRLCLNGARGAVSWLMRHRPARSAPPPVAAPSRSPRIRDRSLDVMQRQASSRSPSVRPHAVQPKRHRQPHAVGRRGRDLEL